MTLKVLFAVMLIAIIGMAGVVFAAEGSFIPPVSNGDVKSVDTSTVELYVPPKPCTVCPEPTPTPIPPEKVGVDFTISSSAPWQSKNEVITLTGFQTSGTPFSNDVQWRWNQMVNTGSMTIGGGLKPGQITSFKITKTGTYIIQMRVIDKTLNLVGTLDRNYVFNVRR